MSVMTAYLLLTALFIGCVFSLPVDDEDWNLPRSEGDGPKTRLKRNAVKDPYNLWPMADVFYQFNGSIGKIFQLTNIYFDFYKHDF